MRKRIISYITILLILIMVVTETSFILINRMSTSHRRTQTIVHAVSMAAAAIEDDDDEIDFDEVDLYVDQVTIAIYNEKKQLVLGTPVVPAETFLPGEVYAYTEKGRDYLVYDVRHKAGTQDFYVRGVYAVGSETSLRSAFIAFLIVLPLGILLAIVLSTWFVHATFRPVSTLTSTADTIAKSADLSQRLPLHEPRNELYDLTVALNDMLDQLETALNRERDFTADVSHEIKTPLSAILLECDNALAQPMDDAAYQEALTHIRQQTRMLLAMVGQLLDMTRSLSQEDVMDQETLDLSLICEATIEQYRELHPGIRFTADIAEDVLFYGDETLMIRMLNNLLNNAVRYCDVSGHVTLTLKKAEDIIITVADNGCGISPEDLPRIFDRFYKADKARSDEHLGLGLSMVRWIVQAHHGEITVMSKAGEGTTFTITLPITKS